MKKHTMSLVMAAGLLGSVASPGQQSPSSEPSAAVPTLSTYSHRVVLDVVVTDGKGRPVSRLSRSDFQVFENGAPQTLRSFEIVRPEPAQAPATVLHLPPNTFSNMATPPQDGPLTVLLYDVLNTPVEDLPYAHAKLVDFLKKRQRGAPMAIFVLGRQLRMLQGFTLDQNALLRAVDERDAKMAQSTLLADPEHPYAATAEKNPGDSPTPDGQLDQMFADLKDLEATERILRQQERLDLTDDAFAEIARFLAGFPGRKSLLWLSGSFPTSVLPSPNPSASGTPNEFNDAYDYGERNKVAADLLAQSHVAVYAVDIRGLQTSSAYNAGSNRQRPVAGFNRQFSADLAAQSTELANEHASLEQVARETGGRAFYNTNGLDEAMDTAMQLGGTYYTLSWSPTNDVYDGKLRSIRVAVTGGYQLEYRRSYYAVEQGSTQPLPAPSSTQIQFVANVLPQGEPMPETPTERDRRKFFETASEAATMNGDMTVQHFAVNVALFGNELTFQQVSDSHSTFRLLFNVATFGADGRELTGAQTEVRRTLTADQQQKTRNGELRDSLELAVPVNARTIMIGVMDLSSNRIGTLEVPVPASTPAH
jgi:VWFA-related protein